MDRKTERIRQMPNTNKIKKENRLVLVFISLIPMFAYAFTISNMEHLAIDDNIRFASVFAQMNSPNGSSTTIFGDIVIPSNSNDTMTTAVNNTDKNAISTSINKTLVGQNVSSAVNFLKEEPTFPISPTGISTQGLHQPPQHRLVNNSFAESN